MDEVKVIPVIICNKERRGTGVESDPYRNVKQIYDLDGNLIMEQDDYIKYNKSDLYKFAIFAYKDSAIINTPVIELIKLWENESK